MLSNILRTGFSLRPFLVVRNFSTTAQEAIQQELSHGDYDLIHAETFYAMPHLPRTKLPVVLVDQTIEYQVYQHYVNNTAPAILRPLLRLDVAKLKYWERYYWRQATKVLAVSNHDKKEMLKLEPNLSVDIVPNGVNMDLFKPKISWNSQSPTILFVGNFYWLQNTEAAKILIKKILPLVQKRLPRTKVAIVGQHQPQELLDLSSKSVIVKQLSEDDFAGIVDAYHSASVFAAPIRGPGGTRLKNLAAMASQLPVISTSVGVKGLSVKNNHHVLIRNTPVKMASAIIRLLQHPKQTQKLALAARKFAEDNFDYKVIANHLDNIYQSLHELSPS
jgi:glycosyltransferase involved in cell wall biosynthesis